MYRWSALYFTAGIVLVFAAPAYADPPILPDAHLTPGAAFDVTKDEVCRPGYTKNARHVSVKTKRRAYMEYGIKTHKSGDYEVDHLISLELGGSNDIKNLWPQSYKTTPWNAHVKDRLEDKLHDMVCKGEISMSDAQHTIASNWIEAYKKYVGAEHSGE